MLRNILLVFLAFIAFSKCDNSMDMLPRMVGGAYTDAGEFPSVVSIRVPQQKFDAAQRYCVGTIINVNHVLTSAQCAHNDTNQLINPSWFRIIAGDLNMIVPSYRRFETTASHIFTHPDYTLNPLSNDLAVFRTSQPFPTTHNTIDWAVRNTRVLPERLVCTFVGWGLPTDVGYPLQQRLNVTILSRNVCNAADVHQGQVIDQMICAGSEDDMSGVCTGNLGGGLFCHVNDWYELTGVLSFGIGCGAGNVPGVYTQVRFFEQWINAQLVRTDATPPGTLVVA